MSQNLNRIANASLTRGKGSPTKWTWESSHRRVRWNREPSADGSGKTMRVVSDDPQSEWSWSQVVRCAPDKYYRVEALVSCDIMPTEKRGGLRLTIEPIVPKSRTTPRKNKRPESPAFAWRTPAMDRSANVTTLRAIYQAPPDIRELKVSIGAVGSAGLVEIHEVRFISVLEPDEESHPMAIPPPASAHPARPEIARVTICSLTADSRAFTNWARGCFGDKQVSSWTPADFSKIREQADAIFLPDTAPPPRLKSLRQLLKLSEEKLVVISLLAFAKLAGSQVKLKRIEQPDDPTFAKVMFANHATRGFALHDIFPLDSTGKPPFGFAQNQFRKSEELDAFCKRHGFVTLLASMCNLDRTSNQPICLWRENSQGGLLVFDIEPLESPPSTMGEINLAAHFLLTALGKIECALGQFVVPAQKTGRFREFIREMAVRFAEWTVHDDNVPTSEVKHQLVTLGRDDLAFGLPLKPKPVILLRSGLRAGDVLSVYSTFFWLKQLLRMPPHACLYAQELGTRFRIAWLPCTEEWNWLPGWENPTDVLRVANEFAFDSEDSQIAAIVDVASSQGTRPLVSVCSDDITTKRFEDWLPRVFEAYRPGSYYSWTSTVYGSLGNRNEYRWNWSEPEVIIRRMERPSLASPLGDAAAKGTQIIRMEVPDGISDFSATSIQRTDFTATLLEQVVGLLYGLIAVNRTKKPVQLDGFQVTQPGEALVVDRMNHLLTRVSAQAG